MCQFRQEIACLVCILYGGGEGGLRVKENLSVEKLIFNSIVIVELIILTHYDYGVLMIEQDQKGNTRFSDRRSRSASQA